MEVQFTYCKMNTFPGYSLVGTHPSTRPPNPHPHQDRAHFHPPRKIARSHFVFKLLASERPCAEIIKANCVERRLLIHHLGQTQALTVLQTGRTCGDGRFKHTPRAFSGTGTGALSAAWLALDCGPKAEWVSFLGLCFRHQAGFRKREVGAG